MSTKSEQRLRRLEQAAPKCPYREIHFPHSTEQELVLMRDLARAALKGDEVPLSKLDRLMTIAAERETAVV